MKNLFLIPVLLALLLPGALFAQELPRPSTSKEVQEHTLPSDYNMKAGPVFFNVTGSVEGQYIDNVGLTKTGETSDFTLTPEVGLAASWPITESNTLNFATSLGYTKYFVHPQYDTTNILVSPNSRLAFDVYIGNFKIDFHDAFSYQHDPINEAAFNNVVNFDRFTNDVGVSGLWDLNRVILNLNYDHINFISTGIQSVDGSNLPDPNLLDYSADQVSGSLEAHFSSTLNGGVEATASSRAYDHYSGSYTQWTAGPYLRVEVGQHVAVQASGGYQNIDSPNNIASNPSQFFPNNALQPKSGGANSESYYVNLTIDHQVNTYYFQRFSFGHDINLGILGNQSDASYANYSGSWHVNRKLNLALTLSYEDVSEVGGLVPISSYQLFDAGLEASFPVTKSISGSIIYQFADKFDVQGDQSYEQNKFGFLLTYEF